MRNLSRHRQILPPMNHPFVSILENIEVERSEPAAKIIVNSRTGTLVISGNVKVTPAAVSHGTLSVKVSEDVNIEGGDATAMSKPSLKFNARSLFKSQTTSTLIKS